MTPSTPPPEPTRNDPERDIPYHYGRVVLFVFLILLSPVAAFLCGFCCCLGVMQFEGAGMYGFPGDDATFGFFLGIIGGLILTVFLLVRLHKRLFANRPNPPEDETSDGPAPPL